MRITFVIPRDGMMGGVRVVAIYADRLIHRGHRVVIVCGVPQAGQFRGEAEVAGAGTRLADIYRAATVLFTQLGIPVQKLAKPRPVIDADIPESDVVIATGGKRPNG